MIPSPTGTSPEKTLLIEILKSAVRDILSKDPPLKRSALCWLESDDGHGESHFSFIQICDELGLPPHDVRVRIKQAISLGIAAELFDRRVPTVYTKNLERRRVNRR
jgi:hypothetical protein